MRKLVVAVAVVVVSLQLFAINLKTRPAPKGGFRADFLHDLDEIRKRMVALPEAGPADKYDWRPAPGVRSISEVYMHIAGGNYVLASFVGMKAPGYDTRSLEGITDEPAVA